MSDDFESKLSKLLEEDYKEAIKEQEETILFADHKRKNVACGVIGCLNQAKYAIPYRTYDGFSSPMPFGGGTHAVFCEKHKEEAKMFNDNSLIARIIFKDDKRAKSTKSQMLKRAEQCPYHEVTVDLSCTHEEVVRKQGFLENVLCGKPSKFGIVQTIEREQDTIREMFRPVCAEHLHDIIPRGVSSSRSWRVWRGVRRLRVGNYGH